MKKSLLGKKSILSLLTAALLFIACQNFDDKFANLEKEIADIEAVLNGSAQVNTDLVALQAVVKGLSASYATDVASMTADLNAIQTQLNSVSTSAEVDKLKADLAAIELSVNTLLASNAVIAQNITITNRSELQIASELYGTDPDDLNVIIQGNVTINTDTASFTIAEIETLNKITSKMGTILGNLTITSVTDRKVLNLSGLSYIDGNYTLTGVNQGDDNLTVISGNLTLKPTTLDKQIDYSNLTSVLGGVTIESVDNLTHVQFGSASIGTFKSGVTGTAGVLSFPLAEVVEIGKAPFTSLSAPKARIVTSHLKTATAGIIINAPASTEINVDSLVNLTGALSITATKTTVVNFKALKTVSQLTVSGASKEVNFPALESSTSAINVVTTDKADFSSLKDINIASSIGGTTVMLTGLVSATANLTLPNATSLNLSSYNAAGPGELIANKVTTASFLSGDESFLKLAEVTNLTLSGLAHNVVFDTAGYTKLTTLSVSGRTRASSSTTAITNGVNANNTSLTSITVGGELNTFSSVGATALTSLSTTGSVNVFTLSGATALTSVSIGHTYVEGVGATDKIITGNTKLTSLTTNGTDRIGNLNITGNLALTSLDLSSFQSLPTKAGQYDILINNNKLTGTFSPATATSTSTRVGSNDLKTLDSIVNKYINSLDPSLNVKNFNLNLSEVTKTDGTTSTLTDALKADILTTQHNFSNSVEGGFISSTGEYRNIVVSE